MSLFKQGEPGMIPTPLGMEDEEDWEDEDFDDEEWEEEEGEDDEEF